MRMRDLIRRILNEQFLSKTGKDFRQMKKFVRDKGIHNTEYFEKNYPNEYKLTLENDWLLKIAKELDFDDLGDINKRKIYAFIWEKPEKKVYVGLTLNPPSRYRQHLEKLIRDNPDPDKFYVLTSKFLTSEEAQEMENTTVCNFKKNNYKILNKYRSKSLGFCTKDLKPYEHLIQKATDGSVEDIKYEDPQLYHLIKKGKLNKIGSLKRSTTHLEKPKKIDQKSNRFKKGTKEPKFINVQSGDLYYTISDVSDKIGVDDSTILYNLKNKGNYDNLIFPYKLEYEPNYDNNLDFEDENMDLYEIKNIVKRVLIEQSSKINLLKVIKNEDIFVAAELVGGMDNLKRILKDEPEITDMINSLKGKLDLVHHSRKEYLEFPMEFEIVGKGINNHKTNSWPIINLIYDDSKLSESEKKLFEQFVYDSIGDLSISNVKRNPKTLKMFREKGDYMALDYVNGKDWESLDHNIRLEDNDMRNLHREYYTKSYMNESKDEPQNKKVKLVKQMIYDIFDEVTNIEQSTYLGKPLLTIYFKTDSKAANITSWFAEYVIDEIDQLIGDNVVVLPFWVFHWDPRLKNVDIYINTKQSDEDGNVINESKILQENEEDPTRRILNFLLRRYKVEDIDLGWDGNPIKFKTIKFDVDGEKYGFTTFENKREQIRKIVDMLIIHNIIEPIDPYERQLDTYTQKVIRAVKAFLNEVM